MLAVSGKGVLFKGAVFLALFYMVTGALADTVVEVTLYQTDKRQGHIESSRFPARGLVELFLLGARAPESRGTCQDVADAQGRLSCTLVCDDADDSEWVFELKFEPQPNANYRIPLAVQLTLKGCSVAPKSVKATYVHQFAYEDLSDKLKKEGQRLRRLVREGTGLAPVEGTEHYDVPEFIQAMLHAAVQPEDVNLLPRVRRITNDLSIWYLYLGDQDNVALYSGYSMGATNAMLDAIAKKFVSQGVLGNVGVEKIASLNTYYSSLVKLQEITDSGEDRRDFAVSGELADTTLSVVKDLADSQLNLEQGREIDRLYKLLMKE